MNPRGIAPRLSMTAAWLTWAAGAVLVGPGLRPPFLVMGLALLLGGTLPILWQIQNDRVGGLQAHLRSALPATLALVMLGWVYCPVLTTSWMGDDPRLLRSVAEHGWLAHFIDPAAWRALSGAFFTPLLPASFGLDLHLFGLNAAGFYAHHLLSMGVILVLLSRLISRWFSPLATAVALLLLVLSSSAAGMVQQLMTRHYLEGLALFLVAVLLLRRGSAGGAAACALLAMLCKEVYVPLVAVATLAPLGIDLRRRFQLMMPTWLALVVYLAWRVYMLGPGNSVSGYSSGTHFEPARWLAVAGLNGWLQIMVAGAVVVAAVVLAGRSWPRSKLLFWCLVMVAVVAPLIPVVSRPAPRYLLLPSVLGAMLAAFVVERLSRLPWGRGLALALSAVLLTSAAVAESPWWADRSSIRGQRLLADLVLHEGDETTLVLTETGSDNYFHSLAWLRRHVLGLGAGPRVCRDLCVCRLDGVVEVIQLDGDRLVRLTPDAARRPEICGDPLAALDVEVSYRPVDVRLSWHFGPYEAGRFFVAGPSDDGEVSGHFQELPANGEMPFTMHEKYLFVVRYQAPEGWTTDSPWLKLTPGEPNEERRLKWQRSSDATGE